MKKVLLNNGRELLIRQAVENDGEAMAEFKTGISGESPSGGSTGVWAWGDCCWSGPGARELEYRLTG